MLTRSLIVILAVVAVAVSVARADGSSDFPVPPMRLELELSDGTRLVGATEMEGLTIRAPYATATVPLDLIQTASYDPVKKQLTIDFHNGDRIRGAPEFDTITLETSIGPAVTAIDNLTKLRVSSITTLVQEGLVLHYTFTAGNAGHVIDRSGSEHHGKAHGVRKRALPGGWHGVEFDGDSHIKTPPLSELGIDGSSDLSIALWFMPANLSPRRDIMLVASRLEVNQARGLAFSYEHGRRFSLQLQVNRTAKFAAPLSLNQWSHIVLVRSERQWSMFHEGREISLTASMRWPARIDLSPELPIYFGKDPISDAAFQGLMTDIRVYDRPLETSEIERLAAHRPAAGGGRAWER